MRAKFKIGDLVRVNEAMPGQEPIYWKGKVVKIINNWHYGVEDINPNSSYYKEVFTRNDFGLTYWDTLDNVNI